MKIKPKIVYIPIVLLFIFFLSGCEKKEYTALDYFPFAENAYYEYDGGGFALAEMQTFAGYVRNGRMQRRNTVNENYSAQMEIFEYKNGTITMIRADDASYYIEDATYLYATMDVPVLREPIELNNEWRDRHGNRSRITAVNKRITVPYGTFNVIEVTTEVTAVNSVEKYYFAPGVGLVESRYSINDGPWIISRLKSVTKDHQIEIPAHTVYPDGDGGFTAYETPFYMKTNGDAIAEVSKILTAPSPDGLYGPIISKGSVTGITVLRADDTSQSYVIVEVSAEAYDINDSEEAERDWLFALCATAGASYRVDYAAVYVNGLPYAGKFIRLEPEDFIFVGSDKNDEFYLE